MAQRVKMHSSNRLTCEPCRERKVKCNRVYPECNRCARLGYKCSYRDRISHRATQAAVIQQLQERMSQAEARLARQGITSTRGTPSPNPEHQRITPASASLSVPPSSSSASSALGSSMPGTKTQYRPSPSPIDNMHVGFNPASMAATMGGPSDTYAFSAASMVQDTSAMPDFDFNALEGANFDQHDPRATGHAFGFLPSLEMNMGSPRIDWQHINRGTREGEPSLEFRPGPPSLSTDDSAMGIATEDMAGLHQIFFDTFATAMPILCEDRFYRELRASPHDLAINSVSHTIALLAILVSESYKHLEKRCYTLARRYIDACESDDEQNTFTNINFLQALLFLTRYELGKRTCTRAAMVLGRAVRLGRMLRLDELDKSGKEIVLSSGIVALPQVHLREIRDIVDLEERRRCLWGLYILEGYSTLHTGLLGSLNDERIFVSLPSPGNLESTLTATQLPTLIQVTSSSHSLKDQISPFTGAVLVVSLLRKVVQHTQASDSSKMTDSDNGKVRRRLINTTHHSTPGFWDRHYHLVKDCSYYNGLLQPFSDLRMLYTDPLAFNIYLTICAIELRLWEAAVDEAEQRGLSTVESMKQVQACSLKIANTVQLTWGVQRMTCDNMSMSGAFVAWPICMAIKGLNRQRAHLARDETCSKASSSETEIEKTEISTLLQVLQGALDDVESPTGPWHQSMMALLANTNSPHVSQQHHGPHRQRVSPVGC